MAWKKRRTSFYRILSPTISRDWWQAGGRKMREWQQRQRRKRRPRRRWRKRRRKWRWKHRRRRWKSKIAKWPKELSFSTSTNLMVKVIQNLCLSSTEPSSKQLTNIKVRIQMDGKCYSKSSKTAWAKRITPLRHGPFASSELQGCPPSQRKQNRDILN